LRQSSYSYDSGIEIASTEEARGVEQCIRRPRFLSRCLFAAIPTPSVSSASTIEHSNFLSDNRKSTKPLAAQRQVASSLHSRSSFSLPCTAVSCCPLRREPRNPRVDLRTVCENRVVLLFEDRQSDRHINCGDGVPPTEACRPNAGC
jgi:hypothetical protein